jgi:membrane protein YqaA with SNARE-associated domain
MRRERREPREPRERRETWAAAAWGLAEATLFFLVPDVYLTRLALRDGRRALLASLAATGGALLGGALMWAWAAADAGTAFAMLERVPAVSPAMLARVREELVASGWLAVLFGPARGTPYKLYAATSAALGMGLGGLLLVTVPARLVRFVALSLLAAWLGRGPLAGWSLAARQRLHLALWTVFYGAYFALLEW